ncbi:MAG: hypothetical protein WCC25_09385 [Candidatus Korobacteraceae bacterium]
MELLLNLIWVALAMGSFAIFMRRQDRYKGGRAPYWTSLFALTCILLLLFPIISASDDLHPSQTLMEDATRRVLHFASPQHSPAGGSAPNSVPVLLLGFLLALTSWPPAINRESKVRVLQGHRFSRAGRGPPPYRN